MCVTTFLVQKYLKSTTTVRVINSAPAIAPTMLFVSYKYTCHVDLVLHALLYTNIVNRKLGPFGGNLDKNATN